ncbi:hypothetical protein B0H19DRAFT_522207 [Mycena capillaripes]|nr:hypothetical protein B0H19DRAFT_522207 [Mycena capillaripes]
MILDSCHSGLYLIFPLFLLLNSTVGGLGRDVGTARTRSNESASIPPDLDSHLWKGDTAVEHFRLRHLAAKSHVLLAACRATEKAQEIYYKGTKRGRFTYELIAHLRSAPHWRTTYRELIDMIPVWDAQNPHCGGARSNRLLFNNNDPVIGRRGLSLKPISDNEPKSEFISEPFFVAIGAMEGIVPLEGVLPGTEFHAYDGHNKLLCTLVAQSVQLSHAILAREVDKPAVDIPRGSVVRVSDWKNHRMVLGVYTPADFPHMADLFPTSTDRPPKFVQAELEKAHVVVRSDGDEIVIEPRTTMLRKCITEVRFPLGGNPAHLPDVFDGVAHFNYFLDRENKADPLDGFALEMHQLRGKFPTREPDSSVGKNGNMVIGGAVRFVSDKNAKYGFTIRNTSPEKLFPYLFYFDPEEYTIEEWYTPENRNAAPLDANDGKVTLGMGGEKAFEFSLPPGKQESSGFLKLFVTREYIDLEWINQRRSPFDPRFVGPGRLKAVKETLDSTSTWDASTVMLTMVSK